VSWGELSASSYLRTSLRVWDHSLSPATPSRYRKGPKKKKRERSTEKFPDQTPRHSTDANPAIRKLVSALPSSSLCFQQHPHPRTDRLQIASRPSTADLKLQLPSTSLPSGSRRTAVNSISRHKNQSRARHERRPERNAKPLITVPRPSDILPWQSAQVRFLPPTVRALTGHGFPVQIQEEPGQGLG
jgi:hypothetical protein